jgi:hypothetical protein
MKELGVLENITRKDLIFNAVAGKQILSALLQETGLNFARGYVYRVLQNVMNEARRRHLLVNPISQETYSSAVGNTNRMRPSATGWEQTKGILARHLHDAAYDLIHILSNRNLAHNARVHPVPAL